MSTNLDDVKVVMIDQENQFKYPQLTPLDGRMVLADTVPDILKEYWNLQSTPTSSSIGIFQPGTVKNEICQLISSAPVINPINGGLAVAAYAFKPINLSERINIDEQFMSLDSPNHPVFAGVLLNSNITEKTLKAVRIITRIPVDGIKITRTTNVLNEVPVPALYQIFGTHDDINETPHKDPAKLNWEGITHPTRIEASAWSFASPTSFVFNEQNYDKLKYRGFKFVVYEWNYDHASNIDKHPGFYRVSFDFVEDGPDMITLPNLIEEGSTKIMAIDLNNPMREDQSSDVVDLAEDEINEDEIDEDERTDGCATSEGEYFTASLTYNPKSNGLTERDSDIDLGNDVAAIVNLLQLEGEKIRNGINLEVEKKLTTLMTKTKKEIKVSVKNEVDSALTSAMDKFINTVAEKMATTQKGTRHEVDSVNIDKLIQQKLDDMNLFTEEMFNDRICDKLSELESINQERLVSLTNSNKSSHIQEIVERLTLLEERMEEILTSPTSEISEQSIDKLKELLLLEQGQLNNNLLSDQRNLIEESKLQMATMIQKIIDDTRNEWAEMAQATKAKIENAKMSQASEYAVYFRSQSDNLEKLNARVIRMREVIDAMIDDTGILNVSSNSKSIDLEQHGGELKHWYTFGGNDNNEYSIILPKNAEDARTIKISNFRDDKGAITIIAPEQQSISFIYNRAMYPNQKSLGLTAKGERISLVFMNGTWHGELHDGIK